MEQKNDNENVIYKLKLQFDDWKVIAVENFLFPSKFKLKVVAAKLKNLQENMLQIMRS